MIISIVIPNFNGRKLLEDNLPSVLSLKDKYSQIIEIIVVDDKSTDDSVFFIKSNFPKVFVIEKNKNTGFVDTVNLGVAKAKGSLVLLLNTDVGPKIEIISKLLPYFQDKNVFAVGCSDNSFENNGVIKRGRGIGKFIKGFLIHQRGEANKKNTLWVSGGSGMFRKSIWEKLGGFDSLFSPFYWEDIDICFRALKSGYKIFFEREAEVNHYHKKGAILSFYSSREIKEISLRNQIIFVWKNISDLKYLLEHLFYLPLYLVKDKTFFKALLKAFLKLPVIFIQRTKQRKLWLKSDSEILAPFSKEFAKRIKDD